MEKQTGKVEKEQKDHDKVEEGKKKETRMKQREKVKGIRLICKHCYDNIAMTIS